MTPERLLAAALWLDELEAQRAEALSRKWSALATEFDGEPDPAAYQARDAELDGALVQPVRAMLQAARVMLEERAAEFRPRASWPAGGSWQSRAYALAVSLAGEADQAVVERELAELRRGQ